MYGDRVDESEHLDGAHEVLHRLRVHREAVCVGGRCDFVDGQVDHFHGEYSWFRRALCARVAGGRGVRALVLTWRLTLGLTLLTPPRDRVRGHPLQAGGLPRGARDRICFCPAAVRRREASTLGLPFRESP